MVMRPCECVFAAREKTRGNDKGIAPWLNMLSIFAECPKCMCLLFCVLPVSSHEQVDEQYLPQAQKIDHAIGTLKTEIVSIQRTVIDPKKRKLVQLRLLQVTRSMQAVLLRVKGGVEHLIAVLQYATRISRDTCLSISALVYGLVYFAVQVSSKGNQATHRAAGKRKEEPVRIAGGEE
jgi:hypothetical protein